MLDRPPRWVTQGRLEVKQGNGDMCAPGGALPATFKTVYDSDSGESASLQDCAPLCTDALWHVSS